MIDHYHCKALRDSQREAPPQRDEQLRMRLAPGSPRALAAALAAKVNHSRGGKSRQDVVLGSGSGSAWGRDSIGHRVVPVVWVSGDNFP